MSTCIIVAILAGMVSRVKSYVKDCSILKAVGSKLSHGRIRCLRFHSRKFLPTISPSRLISQYHLLFVFFQWMATGETGESMDLQARHVMKVFAPGSGNVIILHQEAWESNVKEVTVKVLCLNLGDVYYVSVTYFVRSYLSFHVLLPTNSPHENSFIQRMGCIRTKAGYRRASFL